MRQKAESSWTADSVGAWEVMETEWRCSWVELQVRTAGVVVGIHGEDS